MLIEKVHIPTYSVSWAGIEQVGVSGYRLIMILTSSMADYPVIRLHGFRTREHLTETLLIVRDLSDGFISTLAESTLLRACQPIANNLFAIIRGRDRRGIHAEKEINVYTEASNVLPC
jgi:hypothetical protein